MKKKIGLLLLVLILCMSTTGVAFAEINYDEWNSQAAYPSDVVNTKYFTAVKALTDKKIITGDTSGLYSPEKNISRAEFAVMMAKATNNINDLTAMANKNTFQDMSGYTWAKPYINALEAANMIKGIGAGKFAPGGNVSYVEVIAIILRSKGIATEIENYGTWPANYIYYAQLYNMAGTVIITDWKAPATKGDVALLMYRNMANLKTTER